MSVPVIHETEVEEFEPSGAAVELLVVAGGRHCRRSHAPPA